MTASDGGEIKATVVITTKNRKEDLRVALKSALGQSARPEVLVIDDGSTDGTFELVRREFPEVVLHRSQRSLGYIVQRNRAAELARGDVIFSIDDDAEFVSPHTVEQTLADFDHPRVGAVAIPFIEPRKSPMLRQRAPDSQGVYAAFDYIGTAHALRREVFITLRGYRSYLFHQGEEGEYCLRMLEAGYIVRMGRADPLHHYESPRRPRARMHVYGARNILLNAWYNVPTRRLPMQWIGSSVKVLASSPSIRALGWHLWGLARGLGASMKQWSQRNPVSPRVYRIARELRRRGGTPLGEIEALLPPPQPIQRPDRASDAASAG